MQRLRALRFRLPCPRYGNQSSLNGFCVLLYISIIIEVNRKKGVSDKGEHYFLKVVSR
jgi:hypothetical protein